MGKCDRHRDSGSGPVNPVAGRLGRSRRLSPYATCVEITDRSLPAARWDYTFPFRAAFPCSHNSIGVFTPCGRKGRSIFLPSPAEA